LLPSGGKNSEIKFGLCFCARKYLESHSTGRIEI
jgi:hypothetical protein